MKEAEAALEASLNEDSATPDFGAVDREAYLRAKRDELLSRKISPVTAIAHANEWARTHGDFDRDKYEMVVVAGHGEFWLLYDPETKLFSLANGKLDGDLTLVGFRSSDALGEWLG